VQVILLRFVTEGFVLNTQYGTSLPDFLASRLDAKVAVEGESLSSLYGLALWLGLVVIEGHGGLRKTMEAIGDLPEGARSPSRKVKIPPEARELVRIAEREGVNWQTAQCVALTCGLATIEERGGVIETRRQIDVLRRSVVSQLTNRAA
jgi:hypothetical protein